MKSMNVAICSDEIYEHDGRGVQMKSMNVVWN